MNFVFSNPLRSRYTLRDLRRSNADEGDHLNRGTRLLGWTDKLMHGLTVATSSAPIKGASSAHAGPPSPAATLAVAMRAGPEIRKEPRVASRVPTCGYSSHRERDLLTACMRETVSHARSLHSPGGWEPSLYWSTSTTYRR